MTAVTFDTLQLAKTLQEKGFTQQQAEGMSDALKDTFVATDLATKGDITRLEGDIAKLEVKIDLQKWLIGFVAACVLSLVAKTFF
jgi:hypothetical protein